MKKMTVKLFVTTVMTIVISNLIFAQCANSTNVYSFIYDGKTYEIIKQNKTWVDAASCAVERGGILAEINDVDEQNAIYTELNTNASIITNNTVAPDGGGGAYVWIGGNDLATEGNWIWDGNNDNVGPQFWMGDFNGSPVGGLYNNWGDEPDDSGGQDALGLSLNGWPYGVAGEWNDVAHTNSLYFVVEYAVILSVQDNNFINEIKLYPNPITDFVTIETNGIDLETIIVYNSLGQELTSIVLKENLTSKRIDLSNYNRGVYFVKIGLQNGEFVTKKITK